MSGWDQRGDIEDLNRRLRNERIQHRIMSIIFLVGALLNLALGVKRSDPIQIAIGAFLLIVYAVNRR